MVNDAGSMAPGRSATRQRMEFAANPARASSVKMATRTWSSYTTALMTGTIQTAYPSGSRMLAIIWSK